MSKRMPGNANRCAALLCESTSMPVSSSGCGSVSVSCLLWHIDTSLKAINSSKRAARAPKPTNHRCLSPFRLSAWQYNKNNKTWQRPTTPPQPATAKAQPQPQLTCPQVRSCPRCCCCCCWLFCLVFRWPTKQRAHCTRHFPCYCQMLNSGNHSNPLHPLRTTHTGPTFALAWLGRPCARLWLPLDQKKKCFA